MIGLPRSLLFLCLCYSQKMNDFSLAFSTSLFLAFLTLVTILGIQDIDFFQSNFSQRLISDLTSPNFRYPLGSAEISEKYPRRNSTNSYVVTCHIIVTSKSHTNDVTMYKKESSTNIHHIIHTLVHNSVPIRERSIGENMR